MKDVEERGDGNGGHFMYLSPVHRECIVGEEDCEGRARCVHCEGPILAEVRGTGCVSCRAGSWGERIPGKERSGLQVCPSYVLNASTGRMRGTRLWGQVAVPVDEVEYIEKWCEQRAAEHQAGAKNPKSIDPDRMPDEDNCKVNQGATSPEVDRGHRALRCC